MHMYIFMYMCYNRLVFNEMCKKTMEAVSYTKARNNLAELMEKVCNDHDPLIITRQKKNSVVVMSLEDYNAFSETSYLLQSPKNAERLHQAMDDLKGDKNFKKFRP